MVHIKVDLKDTVLPLNKLDHEAMYRIGKNEYDLLANLANILYSKNIKLVKHLYLYWNKLIEGCAETKNVFVIEFLIKSNYIALNNRHYESLSEDDKKNVLNIFPNAAIPFYVEDTLWRISISNDCEEISQFIYNFNKSLE